MGALDECQYIYQHFEIICELWKGVSVFVMFSRETLFDCPQI